MNESHPCFIACDDCLHICEFVNNHKLLNRVLDNLLLQLCIRGCRQCIKECKNHAECVDACSAEIESGSGSTRI